VDLLEEPLKPDYFFGNISLINIFSFAGRKKDDKLVFSGPGDSGGVQVKDITWSRPTGIGITGLVRVCIARKYLKFSTKNKAYK
jgi:hypothetical protein